MLELVQRVNWSEYILILSQGDPPVGLQLIAINAFLVGYWFLRRMAKRKPAASPAWMLPALFIAANLGVVTWGSRLSF